MRLLCLLTVVLSGCVSVSIPENLPENTNLTVNVAIYKSTAGAGNMLEVTTETQAKLPIFGENSNAPGQD